MSNRLLVNIVKDALLSFGSTGSKSRFLSTRLIRNYAVLSTQQQIQIDPPLPQQPNELPQPSQKPPDNLIIPKKSTSFESPQLEVDFAKKIKLITSIDVSKEVVSWINVDQNGMIIDWNYELIPVELKHSNPDFDSLYNFLCSVFEEKIGKNSNAYLFETKRYKAREMKILPTILKIQRCEVIMQSIIKNSIVNRGGIKDEENTVAQQIFQMNATRVGRNFELVVGNERVKSANLVALMIKQSLDKEAHILSEKSRARKFMLNLTQEIHDFYLKELRHKEPLSITFLQAASFCNLVKQLVKINS